MHYCGNPSSARIDFAMTIYQKTNLYGKFCNRDLILQENLFAHFTSLHRVEYPLPTAITILTKKLDSLPETETDVTPTEIILPHLYITISL